MTLKFKIKASFHTAMAQYNLGFLMWYWKLAVLCCLLLFMNYLVDIPHISTALMSLK